MNFTNSKLPRTKPQTAAQASSSLHRFEGIKASFSTFSPYLMKTNPWVALECFV